MYRNWRSRLVTRKSNHNFRKAKGSRILFIWHDILQRSYLSWASPAIQLQEEKVKNSAESKGKYQVTAMSHEGTDLIQDINLPSYQQTNCHCSMTSSKVLFYNITFLNTNPEVTQFYNETISPHKFLYPWRNQLARQGRPKKFSKCKLFLLKNRINIKRFWGFPLKDRCIPWHMYVPSVLRPASATQITVPYLKQWITSTASEYRP